MVSFTIPGIPVAQPRQRHRIAGGGRQFVQNYTPTRDPVNTFKACIQIEAARHFAKHLEGPVDIQVMFVFPRPGKLVWKKRPMPRVRHIGRPDLDNCIKAFKDALKGIAWKDDCQVCVIWADKWVAAGDESPHTSVVIRSAV